MTHTLFVDWESLIPQGLVYLLMQSQSWEIGSRILCIYIYICQYLYLHMRVSGQQEIMSHLSSYITYSLSYTPCLDTVVQIFHQLFFQFPFACFSHSKNTFGCLFSVYNITSMSHHEQVCLMKLRFKSYFSHYGPMMGEVSLETQPH